MAGNKDVELVVRARNEATRILKTVEEALTDVADAQRGIVKEGGSAETMMTRLGRSIVDFQRAAGTNPTKDLTDGLGRAQQAMKGLEVEAEKTQAELKALNQGFEQAKQATAGYQAQTEKLHQTMRGSARELGRMQAAHAEEERALRRAGNEVDRFATRQETATRNVERSRQRITEAREEYGRLGRALVQVGPANRDLVNEFNRAGRAIGTAENGLRRHQAALAEETASLERATAAQSRQSRVVEESAAALARQRSSAAQSKTAFQDNVAAITNAQRAETKYASEIDRTSRTQTRQAAAIREVKAETESLTATQAQAEAALSRLARSGALPVFQSFKQVQAAMVEARTASQQQIVSTNALARSMDIVGPPTRQQVVDFAAARTESARLKAEYLALAEASTRLNAVMRQKPTDAAGLARQQQQAAAALAQLRTAQEGIRATNRAAVGENNRLAESYNRTGAGARSLGAAKRQAAQGSRELKTELDRLYGSGRQSLGLFQRLRGQVLGLTASYVGLFSAVEGVRSTIGAFRTLEAAQNRLGAVFGQNLDKVNGEIDFLFRNSRRLGISFQTLADDYGKFAVAASGSGFGQQAIRDVFLSIAEAGRVNKLSPDRMQLVFFAMQQMISKTKVQAEELTRQLSESLPGATQIFADALAGGNVAQLLKDMQDGNVAANESNMLKVAEAMNKTFGGQLEASLEATTTQIDQFFGLLFEGLLGLSTRGTFIEKFTALLGQMNEQMQSPEGVAALQRLSNFMGSMADVVGFATSNINLLLAALLSIGGIRLIPVVMGMISRFREFGVTAAVAGGTQMTAFKAGVASSSATVITFSGVLATCRTALLSAMTAMVAFGRGIATGSGAALVALIARLRALPAALAATVAGFSASATAGAAFTATAGVLRTSLIALRAAFLALWSATGVGLLVVGASLLFSNWATSADDATEALVRSEDSIRKTRDAYQAARRSGASWGDEMRNLGVTAAELRANVTRNTEAMETAFGSLDRALGKTLGAGSVRARLNFVFDDGEIRAQRDAIVDLVDQYREGSVEAELLTAALDNMASNTASDYIRDLAQTTIQAIDAIERHKQSIQENGSALTALRGTAEAAEQAARDLGLVLDNTADSTASAAQAAEAYREKLDEIRKLVPGLAAELERLADVAKLDAIGFGPYTPEQQELLGRAGSEVALKDWGDVASAMQSAATGAEAAAVFLRKAEGFIARPQWDVNADRVGFGSDTITLADGTIRKVTKGMQVSVEDANRDLIRRIGEFQNTVRGQIGAGRFDNFTPAQQGALTSIAYNYGSLPQRIVAAVRSGSTEEIGRAIRGLQFDNNGINQQRRLREAGIFERGGSGEALEADIQRREKVAEEDAKRLERQTEYNEGLNEELRLKAISEANDGRLTREAFIQKEVQDEINKAKQAGVTLDESRLATIRELAGLEYDRQNANREGKADTQEATRALEQANALYQQQSALVKGIEDARKQGDQGRVTTLEEELVGVNEKLLEAIANARAMWQAVGGDASIAPLTRLDTLEQRIGNQAAKLDATKDAWADIDRYVSGQLASSFDNLAKAISEGEDAADAMKNAFLGFASDFLRKIAQMIIEQAVFNALQGFMGGSTNGGGLGGVLRGLFGTVSNVRHGGGMAGGAGVTRRVSPAWFAGAARYHEGGLAGLRPGEVPAILMRNEEILTRDDPRHILNGGAGGGGASPVTVVNAFDAGSFMAEALGSREGQQMLLNFVRANSSAFKGALG